MKLKKFNIFEKREGFDDIYDPYEDYEDDNFYSDDETYNPEEDESSDDMDHLCYLLRQMLYNIGMDLVNVESNGLDISISVQFNRKEQLKDIVKVFSVIKKIKKDILAQYEDSFEIWETKTGEPVITFDFNLDDGKKASKGESDSPW